MTTRAEALEIARTLVSKTASSYVSDGIKLAGYVLDEAAKKDKLVEDRRILIACIRRIKEADPDDRDGLIAAAFTATETMR
jgi:hypothetical protein